MRVITILCPMGNESQTKLMWEAILLFNSSCGTDIHTLSFSSCVKIWWVTGMVRVTTPIILYTDARVPVIYFHKSADSETRLNHAHCCYIRKRFVKLTWNIRWLVVSTNIFNMAVGFKGESAERGTGFCRYHLCGLDFRTRFNNVARWKSSTAFSSPGSLCRPLMLFSLLSTEHKMMFNGGSSNCFQCLWDLWTRISCTQWKFCVDLISPKNFQVVSPVLNLALPSRNLMEIQTKTKNVQGFSCSGNLWNRRAIIRRAWVTAVRIIHNNLE